MRGTFNRQSSSPTPLIHSFNTSHRDTKGISGGWSDNRQIWPIELTVNNVSVQSVQTSCMLYHKMGATVK